MLLEMKFEFEHTNLEMFCLKVNIHESFYPLQVLRWRRPSETQS